MAKTQAERSTVEPGAGAPASAERPRPRLCGRAELRRKIPRYTEAERAELRARAQDFLDYTAEQAMAGALEAFERLDHAEDARESSAAVTSARTFVALVRSYLAPLSAADGAGIDPLEARARSFDYEFAARAAPPAEGGEAGDDDRESEAS